MKKERYNPGSQSKRVKRVAGKTSGVKSAKLPTFADVKLACNGFLRERISKGLMKDWKYGIYDGKKEEAAE